MNVNPLFLLSVAIPEFALFIGLLFLGNVRRLISAHAQGGVEFLVGARRPISLKVIDWSLIFMVALLVALPFGVKAVPSKPRVIHENSVFDSEMKAGHLFVSFEYEGNAKKEANKTHIQIGYLGPNADAKVYWYGFKDKFLQGSDFPSRTASIYGMTISKEETMENVSSSMKSIDQTVGEWHYTVEPGDGATSGNGSQLVKHLLEKFGVVAPSKTSITTPSQLEAFLVSNYFNPVETIISQEAKMSRTGDVDGLLAMRLDNWSAIRDIWDAKRSSPH